MILRKNLLLVDEYGGEMLLLDINNRALFVWHDNKEEYERFFFIKTNISNLTKFFDRKLSLFTLMKRSTVTIALRHYENYDSFMLSDILPTEPEYTFPTKKSFYDNIRFKIF